MHEAPQYIHLVKEGFMVTVQPLPIDFAVLHFISFCVGLHYLLNFLMLTILCNIYINTHIPYNLQITLVKPSHVAILIVIISSFFSNIDIEELYLCSAIISVEGSLKNLTIPEENPLANTFPLGLVQTHVAQSPRRRKS